MIPLAFNYIVSAIKVTQVMENVDDGCIIPIIWE